MSASPILSHLTRLIQGAITRTRVRDYEVIVEDYLAIKLASKYLYKEISIILLLTNTSYIISAW